MKNIRLITTDKPSRLAILHDNKLHMGTSFKKDFNVKPQHIYITNSEEIKEGDWVLGDYPDNPIGKVISKYGEEFTMQSLNGDKHGLSQYDSKKIILTTDVDLIKDGVQSIDDEFLEWFVKNPSCEKIGVEVKNDYLLWKKSEKEKLSECYKIIIPKKEPKQAPNPQIIDLSNVEGVEMMVSIAGLKWVKKVVVAQCKSNFIDSDGDVWDYAKPILPQYTLKELQEIVGHEFEIKEVN